MARSVLKYILINTKAPITISAQIIGQIKLLITLGKLAPGDFLPTVTQLAEYLGVNHNTIAGVYNQLIESGYLAAKRGKGTFVADTEAVRKLLNHKLFSSLLSQASMTASQLGLGPSEFAVAAYAEAVALSQNQLHLPSLVFVEGSGPYIELMYEAICSDIGIPLLRIYREQLQANQLRAMSELIAADLVVTTTQYLWEITQIAAPEQEVIAVDVKPDLNLLTKISSLPRHARILLVCIEREDSLAMRRLLERAGISHVEFQALSLKELQQNRQLVEQVDGICTSLAAEHGLRQYIPQSDKIMVFNVNVDQTSLSILKARIASLQLAKLLN